MEKFFRFLRRNILLIGTLGGVIWGFSAGFVLKEFNPSDGVEAAISYPGELFFRALKLMILPSVIFSLIMGSASLDIKSNGKIAARTFTYFLATSLFNTVLGVILAVAIYPGYNDGDGPGRIGGQSKGKQGAFMDSVYDLGRNIVPTNILTTFFESTYTKYETRKLHGAEDRIVKIVEDRKGTNFLGVIMISLVIGSVLSTLGERAKPLLDVVSVCETVITKIVRGIMWITPIGVASIICGKTLQMDDVGVMARQLGLFVTTVFVGIFVYQLIFMQLFYFLITRKNPFKFYIGVLPAAVTGFALQSSSAALPVTLQCLDENVKVDHRISRFVVPLGITINMDGTALFVTVASIFIAQLNHVPLGFQEHLTICLLGTAVSIATGTTPSASLAIIFIILQALSLPLENIAYLISVDWFLDRLRTTNNVLGDCYTAAVIQHLSREDLKRMDASSPEEVEDKFELDNITTNY